MQRREKLLLSVVVGGLVLFCGTTAAADLTPQEIAKIKGSTVLLHIKDANGNLIGIGSGFVVAPDHIATNYHVVQDMSSGAAKLCRKEKWYDIRVHTVDEDRDLAVVTVKGIDAPALPLGDSDTVKDGEPIYVVGNPEGLECSGSTGIISAIRKNMAIASPSNYYR